MGVEVFIDEGHLRKLWAEGWMDYDIAKRMGCSRSAVQRRVKKLQLPARSVEVLQQRRDEKELVLSDLDGSWQNVDGVMRWIAS